MGAEESDLPCNWFKDKRASPHDIVQVLRQLFPSQTNGHEGTLINLDHTNVTSSPTNDPTFSFTNTKKKSSVNSQEEHSDTSIPPSSHGRSDSESTSITSITTPSANGISNTGTPPSIPKPSLAALERVSAAINIYGFFTPGHLSLEKPFGSASYTLSVHPVCHQSLNPSQPHPRSPNTYYHCFFRITRLFNESHFETILRTVALGRIYFEKQPTSWIVVMDLRGFLFALKSEEVAPEELDVKEPDHDVVGDEDEELVPVVDLPAFNSKNESLKAAYLGNVDILESSEYPLDKAVADLSECSLDETADHDIPNSSESPAGTSGASPTQYLIIPVTRWDSKLVAA